MIPEEKIITGGGVPSDLKDTALDEENLESVTGGSVKDFIKKAKDYLGIPSSDGQTTEDRQ